MARGGGLMEITGQRYVTRGYNKRLKGDKRSAVAAMDSSFVGESKSKTSHFDDITSLDEVEFRKSAASLSKIGDKDVRPSLNRFATAPLPSSADFSAHPPLLPICKTSDHGCKMISIHTVAQLLRGEFEDSGVAYHLIDCRYPYEYDSGHIIKALNVYTCSDLLEIIFTVVPVVSPFEKTNFLDLGPLMQDILSGENKESYSQLEVPVIPLASTLPDQAIIFYCEFSSRRGPELGLFLRSVDRYLNFSRYPFLFYPHVYVMMSGYEAFYNAYPELCEPRGYMKMYKLKLVDQLLYYSKLAAEVAKVCTACLNNMELCRIMLGSSVGKEKMEIKPELKPVKSLPATLLERNSECVVRRPSERKAILKQCLQLVEQIIRKGNFIIEVFETRNRHISRHPKMTPVQNGGIRTLGLSTKSDKGSSLKSNDLGGENRPNEILNFSEIGEEASFTSRDESMEE